MGHARDTTPQTPDSERPSPVLQGKEAPPGSQVTGDAETLRDVAVQMREQFLRPMEGADLVLIDVDPLVLHAFWRVPLNRFRDAQSALGPDATLAPMFLRIEQVDADGRSLNGSAESFDVRVSGLQSRAYIDVLSGGRTFRASLGLRGKDGAFTELASSNVAHLPPLGPKDRKRQATTLQPILEPASETAAPPTPHDAAGPEPSQAPGPPLPPESSVPQPGEPWPEGLLASQPLLQPTTADLQAGPDVHEGGTAPALQPSEASETSGAEPAPGHSHGTETDEPFVLDEILPLSSYVLAGSGEDVDLEVTAELHIYGRAKPGRAVQLCGKPVRLRPDGSFSIRRILPNDPQLISALLASTDAPESEGNG